jgi:glycosyltransferase involved in cell wall biosynthesis
MRVLHVIPSLAACRGGASEAAIEMVKALRSVGVDAQIICTNDNGPHELDVGLEEQIEFNGVPVRFFKRWSPAYGPLREFAYSGTLRKWLKLNLHQFQLVHVHALFSFTSTYTMCLARRLKVPYIAHPIGSLQTWSLQQSRLRKSIFLNLFEKANLRDAARVHFTAEAEHRQALKVVQSLKPMVIPLGLALPEVAVDAATTLRRKLGLTENTKIVLFLGRLHPKKGLDILLSAFSQLNESNCFLLIAGDGDVGYVEELNQLIANFTLQDRVLLVGFLSGFDKAQALAGADLFVLTSHSENFGIAVAEALAYGTAVLVSEGVALSAQVEKFELGASTGLNVTQVTEKLKQLLSDTNRLRDAGVRGRRYVAQHHDWQKLASQLKAEYRSIIQSA